MRRQRNRKSARSNSYSGSRFTNWSAYHPWFSGQVKDVRTHKFELNAETSLTIIERPLHPDFLRPYSVGDIARLMKALPTKYTRELGAIYLHGGSRKEERLVYRSGFLWGQYRWGSIHLSAFPRSAMHQELRKPLKKDKMIEFALARPTILKSGRRWICKFTEAGLRRFYLLDVLLHEVGHHVDRFRLAKKTKANAERFAEWFAAYYAKRIGDVISTQFPANISSTVNVVQSR